MVIENSLDAILNSKTKVKIIRLFISRTKDFKSTGREIAKSINISPPATHSALKELYNLDILRREILGKQHIYNLNTKNRIVKDILRPSFKKELAVKEDIKHFLLKKIEEFGIKRKILSVILYGSLERGQTKAGSDVDIAVVVKDEKDIAEIENKITEHICMQFNEYFGFHLDAYIKSKSDFIHRLKKNLPPVSSLMKSYSVIFGKEPLEFL